jgi:hypothetical protein
VITTEKHKELFERISLGADKIKLLEADDEDNPMPPFFELTAMCTFSLEGLEEIKIMLAKGEDEQ